MTRMPLTTRGNRSLVRMAALGVVALLLAPAGCQDPSTGGGDDGMVAGQGDGPRSLGDGAGSQPDVAMSLPDGAGGGDMRVVGNNCTPPDSITVTPAAKVAAVTLGTPFTQAYVAVANFAGQPGVDVTNTAYFTTSDATLGTMTGSVFTWAGTHGGTANVIAQSCGTTGGTPLTLSLAGNIGAGGTDPNTAAGMFSGAPSTNAMCNPTLVYPPDGALLPPNTNIIEVHFLRGSAPNNLYEISFSNAVTTIKVYTSCSGLTPADGMLMNGGCIFELSQKEWDYLAQTNRDGDPIKVQVRGVGCDGNKVASSNTRQISFAQQDLVGTLYYWASLRITQGGQNFNSGGVYRYDFGVRGKTAEPVLTPTYPAMVNGAGNPGLCIGCHSISRDGRKMVFDLDDNDSDDEYNDVSTNLYDIAAQSASSPLMKNGKSNFPPGFHTWDRETFEFLLSDGKGSQAMPAGAFSRVDATGKTLGYVQSGGLRGTTPNWSPDDATVAFVSPPNLSTTPPNAGYWLSTFDLWFAGASLYVSPWDNKAKTIGAPTMLFASTGTDNYYYPSYSPEGSFLAFNHAASGPNFHNPLARVEMVVAGDKNPKAVDLARLNDTGTLTNSWARWAPFVQQYKGGQLLWITFSSTRNYGLRIVNDGNVNCYPKESPMNAAFPVFTQTPNCNRAQIWMAAIKLDANGVMQGMDPSFPAFWLPFQDQATNNHLAQWAERSFLGTCMKDADCGGNGKCCVNAGCTACMQPPPPPPAACAMDNNCPPGACCIAKACSPCPADGGAPPQVDGGPRPDAGNPPGPGCNTCLDCPAQACIGGKCDACTNSAQCCAPLVCFMGSCVMPVP